MSILVYARTELPGEHHYALTQELCYDLMGYDYIAVGMHERGWAQLEELFGSAHIVYVQPTYDDEDPVFYYALITRK